MDYRCVRCKKFITTSWLCEACGFEYSRREDRRASTATVISRSYQRRNEANAACEQLQSLWSIVDNPLDVIPKEEKARLIGSRSAKQTNASIKRKRNAEVGGFCMIEEMLRGKCLAPPTHGFNPSLYARKERRRKVRT